MNEPNNELPGAQLSEESGLHCSLTQLQKSLREELTEREEEQLLLHLSECQVCQQALQQLAANDAGWRDVGSVLREESHSDLRTAQENERTEIQLRPEALNSEIDDDDIEGMSPRGTDFIVDFLQPSECRESLGRLGSIEIRAFIGQGAHGIVLKGYQEELNRVVAVKVIAPHLASIPAARKRFSREAKAAAAIVHPNVMPILHVDSSGQLPFLVMPYYDCESLQERIERHGEFSLADVLRIGVQVANGLAAAHAQGLVHRDVKPANILMERGVERVMLTDFGLARTVDDATLTRSGLIAGTPHYMSPEQARGDSVDSRSDLFSLGSVLYAMITGRPPFRAETTYGILRRVTDESVRSVREINSEIPEWLDAIVLKLLQKSAGERFASAAEVAGVLEECLAHHQQPARSALPKLVIDLLPGRRSRIRGAWLVGATVVTLVVVLLLSVNGLGLRDSNQSGEGDGDQQASVSPKPDSVFTPPKDPSPKDSSASGTQATSEFESENKPGADILMDGSVDQQLDELTQEIDRLFNETTP